MHGVWSLCETIVVEEILTVLSYAKSNYDLAKVAHVYNSVVYYSTASFCVLPLPHNVVFRKKTIGQVDAKVKYIFRDTI